MVVEYISDRKLMIIQNKLLKKNLLYLQGLNKKLFKSKRLSFKRGLLYIINQNFDRKTLYASHYHLQCIKGRRRSSGDLFLIMRYYYPEITYKDIRYCLFELLNNHKIKTSYCFDINKRVFYKNSKNRVIFYCWDHYIHDSKTIDEFGLYLKIID
jgi:hypothetical protein